MSATAFITFFPFRLDLVNEQLWRDNQLVTLRPKTLAVLRYLAEHAGRLIPKEELLNTVWKGTRVSSTLPKDYIQELRKALNDTAHSPRFIETVHGRGYRFIAAVTAAPVPSSEFQVLSSDTQDSALSTQHSVMVGRGAELAQLHHWFAKTRLGERQVVFVTGEPGIGKTTLIEAFVAQVSVQKNVLIARGQCFAHYGAGEAYMPMLDALGQLCREPLHNNILSLLQRYAPTWLVQMPSVNSSEELDLLYRRIQGATRERMLREMAEALEAITVEHPLILILEDLHWSDASTLDLLTALAQRKPSAQLLVIGAYRSTDVRRATHPLNAVKNELQVHRQCEELSLSFLAEESIIAYLTARFPDSTLPTTLGPSLCKRTEGNPLFMVNMVDHLARQGLIAQRHGAWTVQADIDDIERSIPESLQQLIEQQMDLLEPHDRLLLEVASVAGVEFPAAAVAAGVQEGEELTEERCATLAHRGQFIRFREYQEWPDGSVTGYYSFVHALYQEVLYRRLTPSRRRRLHQSIGEREEGGYQDQRGEIASILATHFERGRDHARAVRYCHLAGENALRRHAYQEAIVHQTKALALLNLWPDSPQRAQQELMIQVALGAPLIATKGYASPEVERTYARAQELCRQVGETPQLFPVLWGIWVVYFVRGDLLTAKELSMQLLRLAQDAEDPDCLIEACVATGLTAVCLGEFTDAWDHLQRGIAIYDSERHRGHTFLYGQDPGVVCLSWGAWALWFLGYPEQALRKSHEAITLAREQASPFSLAYAYCLASALHQFRREVKEVETYARENSTLSASQGFTFWYAAAQVLLGWTLTEQNRPMEGLQEFYTGLNSWQATGAGFLQPYGFALLSEAYWRTGQTDEGLAALSGAFALVDN